MIMLIAQLFRTDTSRNALCMSTGMRWIGMNIRYQSARKKSYHLNFDYNTNSSRKYLTPTQYVQQVVDVAWDCIRAMAKSPGSVKPYECDWLLRQFCIIYGVAVTELNMYNTTMIKHLKVIAALPTMTNLAGNNAYTLACAVEKKPWTAMHIQDICRAPSTMNTNNNNSNTVDNSNGTRKDSLNAHSTSQKLDTNGHSTCGDSNHPVLHLSATILNPCNDNTTLTSSDTRKFSPLSDLSESSSSSSSSSVATPISESKQSILPNSTRLTSAVPLATTIAANRHLSHLPSLKASLEIQSSTHPTKSSVADISTTSALPAWQDASETLNNRTPMEPLTESQLNHMQSSHVSLHSVLSSISVSTDTEYLSCISTTELEQNIDNDDADGNDDDGEDDSEDNHNIRARVLGQIMHTFPR
ncbi:hypothetical protein BDF22DRAFT_157026 [Syncephalis plumigaleata]|nr:hypothetical protein BDF22DRAFT_157026 [Syncephalis plumigaleata]